MNVLLIFVFFAAVGVVGALFRIYADHSEQARISARRTYANTGSPIWMRNGIAVAPLWCPGTILLGSVVLLPRSLVQIGIAPPIALLFASFVLSYRAPAPFLPRWLKMEIDQGLLSVARPNRWDWATLALIAPIAILTIIGVPLYVLAYG